MKIVTTTSVFPPCWDSADALNRLAAIGYDCLDMAFDYCTQKDDFPFMTDGYEAWADSLRNTAEKLGVAYTHSHACFDAASRSPLVERAIHCASVMGIRYMVVHPVFRNPEGTITDDEEFIRTNAELILPQLEIAGKYGVVLLSENLLWGSSIRSEVIAALADEVNSPSFGWCYDTGHAHAMGDSLDNFRRVSRAPLSLHIQDNHGNQRDEHLLPGDGTLDWAQFFRALKDVNYAGEFVLEAHHQSVDAADEERNGILTDLYVRSRKLADFFTAL